MVMAAAAALVAVALVVVAAVVWADASLVGKRVHRISMSKTVSVTKYKMAAAVAASVRPSITHFFE